MCYSAITPLNFPTVERIASNVTLAHLLQVIPKELASTKSYYIMAPCFDERITLFSSSPPPSLVDAQHRRKFIFSLEKFEYGLSFSLLCYLEC